ncbi:Kruppel-like zinc finger protein, partial [Dinothrombium tinctorium]
SQSITSDFTSLIKSTSSSSDCDIVIVSNDGSEFDAHRLVLKARSPVFKAMFEEEENAQSRIELFDFEAVVINDMLYFIYTDNIVEARIDKIADQLLLAADKYKLPRLKMLCEQYLASKITFEKCDYLLSLSDKCNCKRLREKVSEFMEAIL